MSCLNGWAATLGHIEETKGNVGREKDKEPRKKQNGESNDGTPPQTDGKKKEKKENAKERIRESLVNELG